jgi:glycogen debranching enzyme
MFMQTIFQTIEAVSKTIGRDLSRNEKKKRKERLLTQGASSITTSIAEAVVIKNEDIYFLCQPNGNVPLGGNHGFGLYFGDCRTLNGYELKIAGSAPNLLGNESEDGFAAVFELTNPEIKVGEGEHVDRDTIGIKLERVIDAKDHTMYDTITLINYGGGEVELPISFSFESDFEDVFAIRGLLPMQPGQPKDPGWQDNALSFLYDGADDRYRSISIYFSPAPDRTEDTIAHFHVKLKSHQAQEILISLVLKETKDEKQTRPDKNYQAKPEEVRGYYRKASKTWLGEQTNLHSDSLILNQVLNKSLLDLRTLRNRLDHLAFFSAGIPWFVTLFGRDSIITAMQMLAFHPQIAASTLRLLSAYQGNEENKWKDEQPGKILHELRVGELARLGEIPHTPYYGTVDATPLFLMLMGRYVKWTGDLDLFEELQNNVERAIDWIDDFGALKDGGYISYESQSENGLINQGWKDSGTALVNKDGEVATPPISLVEVQGYAYAAKLELADLFAIKGEQERAERLRQEAKDLKERFNRDYWSDELGFYLFALQKGNRPVEVITSNPGQALWTGIIEDNKVELVVKRLMQEDMFNGWGIRTLSEKEKAYNPIGYHLGTVWPHDNSIIAAAFRRYGYDQEAQSIFSGILEASMRFESYRLPELFAGFSRKVYKVPVHYPVACHPQAWAAGTIPYMLQIFLGLRPDAIEKQLRIVRPELPETVDHLELTGLRIGDAAVNLKFHRLEDGSISTKVARVRGRLDVLLEPDSID